MTSADRCHAQLFYGSHICRCCGRELCAACTRDVREREQSVPVDVTETCTGSIHPARALQGITFFKAHELQAELTRMETLSSLRHSP